MMLDFQRIFSLPYNEINILNVIISGHLSVFGSEDNLL